MYVWRSPFKTALFAARMSQRSVPRVTAACGSSDQTQTAGIFQNANHDTANRRNAPRGPLLWLRGDPSTHIFDKVLWLGRRWAMQHSRCYWGFQLVDCERLVRYTLITLPSFIWTRLRFRTPLCCLYEPSIIACACIALAVVVYDGPKGPAFDSLLLNAHIDDASEDYKKTEGTSLFSRATQYFGNPTSQIAG